MHIHAFSPMEIVYGVELTGMPLRDYLAMLKDAGVHVLTVCPGAINTPFFDAEALERMPPVSKRLMIQPEQLIDAIIDALARGKYEITVPRFIATGYFARLLAPGFMRRNTKRTTIDAVDKLRGRKSP